MFVKAWILVTMMHVSQSGSGSGYTFVYSPPMTKESCIRLSGFTKSDYTIRNTCVEVDVLK